MAESFFVTRELLERRSFQSRAEARMAIFQFIEGWYNTRHTRRRQSVLWYLSPNDFERAAAAVTRPEGNGGRDGETDVGVFPTSEPVAQKHLPRLPHPSVLEKANPCVLRH